MGKQWLTSFFWAPKSLQMVIDSKPLTPWKESYDQPRHHVKKQRHYFVNKGPSSQGYGFPVVMYGCESWTIKKAAAAAAAKLLQSCPTLCDPIDSSPPGSPVPGILQARTLEWVAISLSNAWKWKVKVKSLSRVWLLATRWTAAYQAPLSMGFSKLEYCSGLPLPSPKESWVPMNWCFWIVVLEKTLESSLDCKEIPLVHPKGDQSWVFIGRNDVEAETPILWPPDTKNWLFGKTLMLGKV